MSDKGKYNRGQKWFDVGRDVNGDLKPEITNDPHKMIDVNFYLDAVKREEEVKVTKSKGRK